MSALATWRLALAARPAPSVGAVRAGTAHHHAAHHRSLFQNLASHFAADHTQHDDSRSHATATAAHSRLALHKLVRGDLVGADDALQAADLAAAAMVAVSAKKFGGQHATSAVESLVAARCIRSYVTTGVLTEPLPAPLASGVPEVDTERWLLGFIQAVRVLEGYAVRRAEQLDDAAVSDMLRAVHSAEQALTEFDFRNSELRKRYDGVKYTSKRLEEVQYEVRMALARLALERGDAAPSAEPEGHEPAAKAQRLDADDASRGIITEALVDAMRDSYQTFDALREECIKRCRAPQKSAKNAVHALQRGEFDRARLLLKESANELNMINSEVVAKGPSLRGSGSFSGVVEELAEALLLQGVLADGRLFSLEEVESGLGFAFPMTPEEYMGGVLDTTGELVRIAVRAAGKRDRVRLLRCAECTEATVEGMITIALSPSLGKKAGTARHSLSKIESLLYQNTLISAGMKFIESDKVLEPSESEQPNEN